jgi:hypothetical protein
MYSGNYNRGTVYYLCNNHHIVVLCSFILLVYSMPAILRTPAIYKAVRSWQQVPLTVIDFLINVSLNEATPSLLLSATSMHEALS